MAFRSRNRMFTQYHLMEAAGIFASNPANPEAQGEDGTSLYKGPQEYPRMFYHPEGRRRVIVPGEALLDRDGQPRRDREGNEIVLGQQEEIIWELAASAVEARKLRKDGWHDHPAKAIAAGGGEAPPVSSGARISDLEGQLERLQAELAAARGASPEGADSAASVA